jgi:DNA-binding IclR family transcriptional regulator
MTPRDERPPVNERRTGDIQSVRRALRLLKLFASNGAAPSTPGKQWAVSDLARASGLHKSVVARLMATMAREGFVVQDPATKAYRIGSLAFSVGSAYEPLVVLDRTARPVMENLTARTGHASYLGVPAGHRYVFLLANESIQPVRVSIQVGEERDYHAGAIGKILLMDLDDEEVRRLVGPDPLSKLTPYTIDSVDALLRELQQVRATGVAFNQEESILGEASVAAPVRVAQGRCVAGVAVDYPTHIVQDPEIEAYIAAVKEGAAEISRQLGALSG